MHNIFNFMLQQLLMISQYLASIVITNLVMASSKHLLGTGNSFRNLIWLVGASSFVLSFKYNNMLRLTWLIFGDNVFTGPTSFAPIIETAIGIVDSSGGQYHVLLIIADGQVCNIFS